MGLASLGLLSLVPVEAQAQEPRIYCLRGGSTGNGFNIQMVVVFGGEQIDYFVTPVTVGLAPSGDTSGIRQEIVNAINLAAGSGAVRNDAGLPAGAGTFNAQLDFTDPYCPGWDTSFSVTWSGPENFALDIVNDAQVWCRVGKNDGDPNTFDWCQANPDIVLAAGPNPPPLQQVDPIPTLSQWATGILVLLMATSMVWILRRRRIDEA